MKRKTKKILYGVLGFVGVAALGGMLLNISAETGDEYTLSISDVVTWSEVSTSEDSEKNIYNKKVFNDDDYYLSTTIDYEDDVEVLDNNESNITSFEKITFTFEGYEDYIDKILINTNASKCEIKVKVGGVSYGTKETETDETEYEFDGLLKLKGDVVVEVVSLDDDATFDLSTFNFVINPEE